MGAQAARICSGELGRQWRVQLGSFDNGAPTFDGVQQETDLGASRRGAEALGTGK